MTRIDSATITLDVWDDGARWIVFELDTMTEDGIRRTVKFRRPHADPFDVEAAIRASWTMHELEQQRIRLAAKDDAGGFGPLGV